MIPATTLDELKVTKRQIAAHRLLPNTAAFGKPLMIYHSVFPESLSPSAIEAHLKHVGEVVPQWRYTMYTQSHFHSTTHEVLCVFSGSAKLCFGGEDNPDRYEARVVAGDVIIIPAGVAHQLLEDYGHFQMIGSYPRSKQWDMCYGQEGEDSKVQNIARLDWFHQDPIYGKAGPVCDA